MNRINHDPKPYCIGLAALVMMLASSLAPAAEPMMAPQNDEIVRIQTYKETPAFYPQGVGRGCKADKSATTTLNALKHVNDHMLQGGDDISAEQTSVDINNTRVAWDRVGIMA